MSIQRIEFGVMPMSRGTYPYTSSNGRYCFYEEVRDYVKIVDQQLAEIDSLKAELSKLMSSLEQWDEVFK